MAPRSKQAGADLRRAFDEALAAGATRDYDRAVALLERVIAETDAIPEACLFLGRALQASGRLGAAVDNLERYARAEPGRPEAWFFLGRALLQARRLRPAAACLKRSIRLDDSRAEAWALYGYALLRIHRPGASVRALERAVSLAPLDQRIFHAYVSALFVRSVRLLARGDADMARQILGFVIANGLDGVPQRLYRARAYRELGMVEEALGDCEAALAMQPDDPGLLARRAELLFAAGRPRDAMATLRELRQELPELPELQWDEDSLSSWRALMLLESGDARGALTVALDNVRADPEDPRARAVAAEAYRALGRKDRAVAHYERAVELDPEAPDLRLGLASALYQAGDYERAGKTAARAAREGGDPSIAGYYATLCDARSGERPEALVPRLHELLRSWPADPDLMFALGEALYRSGRPDLASGWFEKVAGLRPDDEMDRLYLVSCAESVGDEAAADAAYAGYLARWPDNASIRRDHVERLAARGAWKETAQAIEAGLAYGGIGAAGRRLLARAFRETGRYREAAALYRELLRADHSDAELLLALAWCLDKAGATESSIALLRKGAPVVRRESAWLALGRIEARLGRWEEAAAALREAAALAPGDPAPLHDLAALWRKAGVADFAERYAREAADLEAAKAGPSPRAPRSRGRSAAAKDGRPRAPRKNRPAT